MKFGFDKVKDFGASALTFGKRNAPSIMTGGGILIGWAAAYIFWKQGKKAEEKIRREEAELNKDNPSKEAEDQKKLPKKEKLTIYLQYCWMALALGLGSTGLTIWAHKIDLSRLAEMYMVSQFLEKKNEDQEKLLDKLKEEVGEKKVHALENDLFEEEYPDEELRRDVLSVKGTGRTLALDKTLFGMKFRCEIEDITDGIVRFNEMMDKKLRKAVEKELQNCNSLESKLKDPMYVSEEPYTEDNPYPSTPVFVEEPVETLLEYMNRECPSSYLGEKLMIRYYSHGARINPYDSQYLKYKNFVDPETGVAQFCELNYGEFIVPSVDLDDRRW